MPIRTIEQAREFRRKMEQAVQHAPDDVAVSEPSLFPVWSADGIAYTAGTRVRYDGLLYRCLTGHTSQASWTPIAAPSLWVRIDDPAVEWPEWVQPTGAHNAYNEGAKVTHNGKRWVSTAANNVWEPGAFGWEES